MKFRKIKTLPAFESKKLNDHCPECEGTPSLTGSQAPSPVYYSNTATIDNSSIELYFSARDIFNRSFPVLHRLDHNLDVINSDEYEYNIELGPSGSFYSDGFMVSQFIEYEESSHGLFTGWNKGDAKLRYRTALGSFYHMGNRQPFEHVYGPRVDRHQEAPLGTSMEFRLIKYVDLSLIMCYNFWKDGEPHYDIGVFELEKHRVDKLNLGLSVEQCAARPTVIEWKDELLMFVSIRNMFDYRKNKEKSYKLYVTKLPFSVRTISKPLELEPVEIEGEDGLMQAYGYPVEKDGRLLLFYNTDFRSPISIAELV